MQFLFLSQAVVQVNSFAQVLTIKALKEVLGSGFHTALKQFQVVR